MPTTLEQWYDWAFKLDWQYHQEQAESKLLHLHSTHLSSKFGKYGGSAEKGKALIMQAHEQKVQPPAMAVTLLSSQMTSSDAMDVDHAGRHPPIKCFNCGKIGHTSRNCKGKREIREVASKKSNFPKQSQ